MPFVQRRAGVVCGCYARSQLGIAEEFLADNNPEVLAYLNPPVSPRLLSDAEELAAAKVDAAIVQLVDATPTQLRTFAQNNFPSLALAEQNRLGTILAILAVAVRPHFR